MNKRLSLFSFGDTNTPKSESVTNHRRTTLLIPPSSSLSPATGVAAAAASSTTKKQHFVLRPAQSEDALKDSPWYRASLRRKVADVVRSNSDLNAVSAACSHSVDLCEQLRDSLLQLSTALDHSYACSNKSSSTCDTTDTTTSATASSVLVDTLRSFAQLHSILSNEMRDALQNPISKFTTSDEKLVRSALMDLMRTDQKMKTATSRLGKATASGDAMDLSVDILELHEGHHRSSLALLSITEKSLAAHAPFLTERLRSFIFALNSFTQKSNMLFDGIATVLHPSKITEDYSKGNTSEQRIPTVALGDYECGSEGNYNSEIEDVSHPFLLDRLAINNIHYRRHMIDSVGEDSLERSGYFLWRDSSASSPGMWNRAFFLLQRGVLIYIPARAKSTLSPVVAVDLLFCATKVIAGGLYFSFELISPTCRYTLRAESDVESDAWIKTLDRAISKARQDPCPLDFNVPAPLTPALYLKLGLYLPEITVADLTDEEVNENVRKQKYADDYSHRVFQSLFASPVIISQSSTDTQSSGSGLFEGKLSNTLSTLKRRLTSSAIPLASNSESRTNSLNSSTAASSNIPSLIRSRSLSTGGSSVYGHNAQTLESDMSEKKPQDSAIQVLESDFTSTNPSRDWAWTGVPKVQSRHDAWMDVVRENVPGEWLLTLPSFDQVTSTATKLTDLLAAGVPTDSVNIWDKDNEIQSLLDSSAMEVFVWASEIDNDLHRTSAHEYFSTDKGRAALRSVLLGHALAHPTIGYCQSFSFLTAHLLVICDFSSEDAFFLLSAIVHVLLPPDYFSESMSGLLLDLHVFGILLRNQLPTLAAHLDSLSEGDEPPFYFPFVSQWLSTLFVNYLSPEVVIRVWDAFFTIGDSILFRVALVILKLLKPALLEATSSLDCYAIMQDEARTLTIEGVAANVDAFMELVSSIRCPQSLTRLRKQLQDKHAQYHSKVKK